MTALLIGLTLSSLTTALLLAIAMCRSAQAKNWPLHTARVIRLRIVRRSSTFGGIYYVHVHYRYPADSGREVACILPSFLGTEQEKYASRLAAFFREDASVPVYVDPSQPGRTLLLPGIDQREWLLLSLMIVVTVAAATSLLL